MRRLYTDGRKQVLQLVWLWVVMASLPAALSYFLGDSKAVLSGCGDRWKLQDGAPMPLLLQATVCVHVRVLTPGGWVAFSYSSAHAPRPELGLEGDEGALYGWLLGVRHRFPLQLSLRRWHQVCLRRDVRGNSFSLEVNGQLVAERTVIAQATRPSGSLRLGCRPRDRPQGAAGGEIELYLFRVWEDLEAHALCQDGSVIGWDTRFWGVSSDEARQRDPSLPCAPGFGRIYTTPGLAQLPVPSAATPASPVSNATETLISRLTAMPTSRRQTDCLTANSGQKLCPSTNDSTDQTSFPRLHPSITVTPPSLSEVMSSTTRSPLDRNTGYGKSTPSSQTTVRGTRIAPAASESTAPPPTTIPAYQISLTKKTPPITTLPAGQTMPTRPFSNGSPLVKCDVAQLCSNDISYYWMFVSVEAETASLSEARVFHWVFDVFGCNHMTENTLLNNLKELNTSMPHECQGNSRLQEFWLSCDKEAGVGCTNCSVVLQFSQSVPVCLLQSKLQRAADKKLQTCHLGHVERVGRGLCEDLAPSDGRFVRCTSPSSLEDICQSVRPSDITCSLLEPGVVPLLKPEGESCSSDWPGFCDCSAFCRDKRQFFALSINISSSSVNVEHIQNMLSKISRSPPCDHLPESRCRSSSQVSNRYQAAHVECHRTEERLHSCMLILQMSGQVDVCTLTDVLLLQMDSSMGIAIDKPLARMVVCGSPGLSSSSLLEASLSWEVSDMDAAEICMDPQPKLRCDRNGSLAVLLTDSCRRPPPAPFSALRNFNISAPPLIPPPASFDIPGQEAVAERFSTAEHSETTRRQPASFQGAAPRTRTTPRQTAQNAATQAGKQNASMAETPVNSMSDTRRPRASPATGTTTNTQAQALYTTLLHITTSPTVEREYPRTVNTDNPPQINTTLPNLTIVSLSSVSVNTTGDYYTLQNATLELILKHFNTTPLPVPAALQNLAAHHTTQSPDKGDNYSTTPRTANASSVATISSGSPTLRNTTGVTNGKISQGTTTVSADTRMHAETSSVNNTSTPGAKHLNTTVATDSSKWITSPPLLDVTLFKAASPPRSSSRAQVNNRTQQDILTTPGGTALNTTPTTENTMAMLNSVITATDDQRPQNTTGYRDFTTQNTATISAIQSSMDKGVKYNQTLLYDTYLHSNAVRNPTTTSPNPTTVGNMAFNGNNQALRNIKTPRGNKTRDTTTTTMDNITAAAPRESPQNITPSLSNSLFTTATQSQITLHEAVASPNKSPTAAENKTVNFTTQRLLIAPHSPNRTIVAKTTTEKLNYTADNFLTTGTPNELNLSTANPVTSLGGTAGRTATISSRGSTPPTDATNTQPYFSQTSFNTTPSAEFSFSAANTASPSTTTAADTPTTTAQVLHPAQTRRTSGTPTEGSMTTAKAAPFQNNTGITIPATTTESGPKEKDKEKKEAEELENLTQDVSQLNSTQVGRLVGRLEKLLEGPSVSQSVGQRAINIISNLIGGDSTVLSSSATRIIRAVDELALKLVVAEESEVLSSSALALAVRTVDGTNFPQASFSIVSPSELQVSVAGRSRISEDIRASVFLPSSLLDALSAEEQRQADRLQFTFYATSSLFQDVTLGNQTTIGPVLGSSVANLSVSNLTENIHFSIRNPNPVPANHVLSCVFWDFTLNEGRGGWSSEGCFVVNATQKSTVCSCNHLTSFAILLDLSRGGLSDRQQAAILTYITYIGCGISAVFLSVTLLTYLCFKKLLRDIPSKILVQLCLSLLFLNLLFLLDGWLVRHPAAGLCTSTAFFLHYFLLTSFTWAGLEAFHMYLSIVRVFTPYLSRYMVKFSLLGWGLPLMVVTVLISVDKDNYGPVAYNRYSDGTSDDFCWLRNDTAFYVGVVAYFLLIFGLSLVVFIVVLVQLARIKRQNPHNQSPQRGLMTDLRSIAGLTVLLGLTWGFALFAWGALYRPFVYLFCIFNSMQGFFIFVFHCAVKENVRRQWRTYLCCGSLRLAENSDWSRMATQNPKNLSVAVATSSALTPASRSSSLISNSSGSVFADSGIFDASNGDVILNEFHRRSMAPQDVD